MNKRQRKKWHKQQTSRMAKYLEGCAALGQAVAERIHECMTAPSLTTLVLDDAARLAHFNRTHSWVRFRW